MNNILPIEPNSQSFDWLPYGQGWLKKEDDNNWISIELIDYNERYNPNYEDWSDKEIERNRILFWEVCFIGKYEYLRNLYDCQYFLQNDEEKIKQEIDRLLCKFNKIICFL